MEHRIRLNLLSTAIVLSLGAVISLVTSTVVASRALASRTAKVVQQEQQLTVKGYARLRVRSDIAVWNIDVLGEAATLAQAFAILDQATQRVQTYLDQRHFQPAHVQLSAIETDVHYALNERGSATRTVEAYTLNRRFTITTDDVQCVAEAAGEVTQLLKDGVHVHSAAPQYTFSRVGDVKIQILGEASADARQRAEEIATRSGCAVTDVRHARMGVIQITEPNSTEVSGYGIYDTSTIDKDASVVVTVSFGIGRG